MASKRVREPFKLGDPVKIRYYGGQTGRIVELWGPLAPGGIQVYRVRVRGKAKPVYIDLREDQIVRLPPRKTKKA
jgi:hypothetical protein